MKNKEKAKVLSCFDVANYFLVLVDREAGDSITQLKLQKLMYFAQGIHLALFDKVLFEEEIKAWKHGPVVPALRSIFGSFRDNVIPLPGEIDFAIYDLATKKLLHKVYSFYGEHSAAYLRNLTHTHSIWYEVIENTDTTITKEQIQEFFKANIINDIKDYLLSTTKADIAQIENAEDGWWMNYDSGVPAEDITEYLLKEKKKKQVIKIESHLV
ncbi:Panacea domain-containing protein [Rickettsia endosymbiont of Nabis limbatus]|uniref:Panacea domain-containing protein n=1 Tax=Rickettsia endosymbiont of Nabis limbatus TaxID=3066268 RepID=UPI003AF3A9ED